MGLRKGRPYKLTLVVRVNLSHLLLNCRFPNPANPLSSATHLQTRRRRCCVTSRRTLNWKPSVEYARTEEFFHPKAKRTRRKTPICQLRKIRLLLTARSKRTRNERVQEMLKWNAMQKNQNKPVGDWISAHSQNFVAMATSVDPQHFSWFHQIGHPRKPPGRSKHLRSICHTSRLIGDFVPKILGSKFWALGGPNQKSKNTFCRTPHGELTAKNGLIPSTNNKEKAVWKSVANGRRCGLTCLVFNISYLRELSTEG